MRRLISGALPFCIAACLAAQDFRATITGQVTDATHAAIPDALVRAVQRSTHTVTETKTNKEGYYTLSYLQPSTYDIEVTAEGFSRSLRENIALMVADKLDLPIVLELGKVSESITVTADSETVVQSGDASGGMNFDAIQTSEYPLNGRQVYMLMDLTPGVLFTQEQFGVSGFSGTRGWDVNGSYVMNGGVNGSNSFTLNGAPISLTGSWQLAPNVEAIQEFKVMTNTYDAQIGRTGGGSVNTTLKSGSNAWHGSMFEYMRNSILDANYIQNNRVGAPRGKHITHQFGGTLGGALQKDREFVFFSFEGFRERVPFPVVSDTPPMDLRDGQHFNAYKMKIYDPLTSRACVPGVDTSSVNTSCYSPYIRAPFPGNVLPRSRISPIGEKILSLYPAPNMPGMTQNFVASNNTGKYRYDQPMGRWDAVPDDRDRIYAIATFQHGHEYRNQNGFPGAAAYGNIWSQRTNVNLIAAWTRILSPTTLLDLRASFGRFTSYFPDGDFTTGVSAQSLGLTHMPHAPTSTYDTPPRVGVDQFTDILGAASFSWGTDNQWNFVPTITMTRGTKTIKMGLDLVYAMRGTGSVGRANGQFNFNRSRTQHYPLRGGDKYDGSGIADLLLGLPGSGYIDYNDTYYRTWPYFGVFIQDDWKVRRNLTLNLGLRYDVQIPFVERWNRVNTGFDLTVVNPVSGPVLAQWAQMKAQYDATNPRFPYPDPPAALLGGKTFIQPGGSRRTYNTDWSDIQPRLGLAWLFARRTVLRTGFGIYYRTATQGNYTDGFSQRTDYFGSPDGGVTPSGGLTGPYSLEDPYPNGIVTPSGRQLGLLTNIGRSVGFDGRQRPIPRTYQYSFGLQRRVPWAVLIDASYVGSVTNHDSMSYEMNYLPWDIFMAGQKVNNFLDRTVPNPFFGILPLNTNLGGSTTIPARELYRPYPLFSNNPNVAGIAISTNPWAHYRYDSLQLRVEKRFFGNRARSGALTTIFSYTYAKNFETSHRLNSWDLGELPVHELVSYDKPQNIAFSGVWDIPFGQGRSFFNNPGKFVSPFISGWNVNWIYRFLSGNPVGIPDTMFSCASYFAPHQDHDHWFNNDTTCYRGRAGYTLRLVADRFPNLRQPDATAINLSASKTFRLTEHWSFNFRAEAFNLMNTPLYGGPSTNYQDVRFGELPLDQRNFPRLVQLSGKILF